MKPETFEMNYSKLLGVILIYFVSLGLCQDSIIVSNLNSNDLSSNSSREDDVIPETLLIQMGNVQNISDLLHRFVVLEQNSSIHGTAMRNGTTVRKGLSAVGTFTIAQPANCQTEQHIIELDKPENGAVIYWPSCVKVRRCGGCCTSSMLVCKPLATSTVNVTVLQMLYTHENPNSFENQGMRVFSVEQHDRCACRCKELPDDCDPNVHDYKENECRCVCKNMDQAALCTGPNKIWDSKYCGCRCRNVRMCSSGRFFNVLSCRCEILRQSLAVLNVNQHHSNASFLTVTSTP